MQRTFLFLLILLPFQLFAQTPPKNVSLVGHLDYPQRLSDVWAYVDSAGREYAILGLEDGFAIIDLSDPTDPQQLQFIPGASTIWRDAIVYGHYAYGSNEGGGGVLIMDLSTLPGPVRYKDTVLNGVNTAHNIWEHQGFLYLVGGNTTRGLDIFDLRSDPWNPAYAGAYTRRYVHDVYIRNDTAYAAEVNEGYLTILDVSDKSNIQVLGSRTYVNALTHNTWLNDAGDVCFTTDETGGGYIIAWDVTDPTDIKELDRIRSSLNDGRTTPHNAHVLNDFIVTSYYADGLHIVDANRPTNLVEVGHYDTSPLAAPGFVGAWGAYPFLPSGLALAADIEEGFFVLQPTYVRAAYLEGKVTEAGTNTPISGVEVKILGEKGEDFTTNSGDYATGLADAGSYTVQYRKYGYESVTRSVSLSNGQVTIENVSLPKATAVNLEISVVEAGTLQPIADADIHIQAVGASFDFKTDGNGQYTNANFLSGTYDAIVGRWGYRTQALSFDLSSTDPTLTIELEKGYYDDFLFDNNWIVDAGASSGNFERGIPLPTGFSGFYFNPDRDLDGDFGEYAYVTGNTGTQPFQDELSGGYTSLISPVMDLTAYQDPIIEFHFWMLDIRPTATFFGPGNDTLRVELIGQGIAVLAEIDSIVANRWNKASFRVKDFLTPSANMRIRFYVEDDDPDDILEVAIDGFEVREGGSVGIDEGVRRQVSMQLYPNPVKDFFYLDYQMESQSLGALSFELLDLQGRSIRQLALPGVEGKVRMDLELPSGMYLGVLRLDGEVVKTVKVVF